MVADQESVTLHSSWRVVAGGYLAPVVLLAVVALGWSRGGGSPALIAVVVVAVVLLAVLLFDYPVSSTFTRSGVERRMPLRRHRIEWVDVRQLTRTSGRLLSTARLSSDPAARRNRGGLVAVVGRKRYLLVDQPESRDEFAAVNEVLAHEASGLIDHDLEPPEGIPPTFVYRRSR